MRTSPIDIPTPAMAGGWVNPDLYDCPTGVFVAVTKEGETVRVEALLPIASGEPWVFVGTYRDYRPDELMGWIDDRDEADFTPLWSSDEISERDDYRAEEIGRRDSFDLFTMERR